MKRKLRMLSVLFFFGLLFAVWNADTARAEEGNLTVMYYVDSVQESNLIGQQQVEYLGLEYVQDVSKLQLDSSVVQAYHTQGMRAEFYRSGKVVSYDASTATACVLYEMASYTVEFYMDSVNGTKLPETITGKGYVGDRVTNRYLLRDVRNAYRPESGYLPGKVYQTITLADADNNVVQVVYSPIVEQSKIYFYNVAGPSDYNTDAILIESNGHFGLVDCGEDLDYPKGNDPKYPLRDGITTVAYANPQDLINFISSKGVAELDFIIFTHAHSDHMGAADEVMRAFYVDTIYAREYDDKYINNADHLWDTQYVYDCMVNTANKYGVNLVQNFDAENTAFDFQDLKIQIKNYETDYEADGVTRQAKADENENSMGVLVTDSYGHKVFLAGDINNVDGDEDKLLKDEELHNLTVLKLAHHGCAGSSSTNFLNATHPQFAVVTNSQAMMNQTIYNNLVKLGTQMYFVQSCKEGITLEVPDIAFTKEKEFSGWVDDTRLNKTYYYVEGEKYRNCEKTIDGKTYRFHSDGAAFNMEWYEDEKTGDWYYYGNNKARLENEWLLSKDKYFYFGQDGRMQKKCWLTLDGKTYYLQEDGAMAANGWFEVDDKYYYFDNNGQRQKGNQWLVLDGIWYYMAEDGSRVDDQWINYKDEWYYLDQDGKMVTEKWAKRDDKWYYLEADGTVHEGKGWWELNKKWYYLQEDGARLTKDWLHENSIWYYMDKDGVMLSSKWEQINGKWYYFKSSGAMVSDGWHQIHNKWYYFEKDGAMYENRWVQGNKKWYYMGKDGAMTASNWAQVDGIWYYFDMDGVMLSEQWGYIGGKWYYFGKSGAMYDNQWLKYKGDWYFFKEGGEMLASGWLHSGGNWYYLQADGTMAVDTTINGKYKINKQGVWVK